ncbi:PAAR domain-containing protein [Ectopseudomonas khazarica]|uniref:Zn-binding Pro-Ala-Ala-Arg (PAAR) domain-containing protein, incolved in TypeVI secretion n=1 Tax=Ectopseudomonas oleovorans TaxID=301 RepID=A0A653B497_ECTOL|nr:PAAR domain-containing protein [Pseudomonas khazarica]CAE6881464.1 Zn-binding Pro-Ala-Ala-Arg (PAAR) domain-containing protein, incolved in TypeVI secretion [Pseudomonas oleovorans]
MSGKPAARLSDPTACPIPGHGTNPIAAGSPDVLFDALPAARMGDASACGGAMAGAVIPTVLINGKPAAVVGSVGSHGNVVVSGSGTVLIGASHSAASFISPSTLSFQGSFDAQYQLTNSLGDPLANTRYLIVRQDGREESGITDGQGMTHRLAAHGAAEPLEVFIEF